MVDIGGKEDVPRRAMARGELKLKRSTVNAIKTKKIKKGDVVSTAKVAGIQAVKDTSRVLPLCHQVPLTLVEIELETYEDMALEKLRGLEERARSEFGVEDVVIVHRMGTLKPGDNIVLVAASSAHRKEVFAACEWLIDELKRVAPIWKKDVPLAKERAEGKTSRGRPKARG